MCGRSWHRPPSVLSEEGEVLVFLRMRVIEGWGCCWEVCRWVIYWRRQSSHLGVKRMRTASPQTQIHFLNSSNRDALSEMPFRHHREEPPSVRDPVRTRSPTGLYPHCRSPEPAIVTENYGTAAPGLQQRFYSRTHPRMLPSTVTAELLKIGLHWRTSEGRGRGAVHLDQQKHICRSKTIQPCVSDNGGYLRT